jgi:phosphoserine phosphatase
MESDASVKEPLAVFDVDGTLFRRGLLPALTRRLVNEEVFPERVREELSEDYYAWVERRGSYEIYDELVVQLFLRELKGASVLKKRLVTNRAILRPSVLKKLVLLRGSGLLRNRVV